MEIKDKFSKIRQLIDQSEFPRAFDEVQKLEELIQFPDDQLTFLNLKSEIFYRMGNLKKALNLTHHVLEESKKQASQIQAIDALTLQSTVLWRLGRHSDSLEAINNGEKILNKMKGSKEEWILSKKAHFLYRRSTIYNSMGNSNLSFKFAKESLAIREKIGNKEDIANSLNSVANFYFVRGDLDQALLHYKRSLEFFEEINDVESIGMMLGNIGTLYVFKGEFNKALNYFQKTIDLLEELGNNIFYVFGLSGIGYVFLMQGKLNEALKYLQKSLNICEEIDFKEHIALNLGLIGSAYTGKGEIKKALENLQRSIEILTEIGVTKGPYFGWFLSFIGQLYSVKGDYDLALENYEKALAIFEEIENPIIMTAILFSLTKINLELKAVERAKEYAERMKNLNEKKPYRSIDLVYRITQALLYKSSDRAIQRAEAQKILQQVAAEEFITFELAVEVLLNLSDLLLDELKSTGSEEALKEIKTHSNRLLKLSKTQNSYYLLSETYLLQSKFALLELDVKGAQQLLSQAELIAEEKGLGKLTSKIDKEKKLSSAFIEKLEELIDQKPSFNEIIEETKLEDLFDQMLKKRIYRKEEEVLEYAVQARALVQTMGKG
ncbi:MAG: tetratricopeptide repeat protein [Promethearchaeota archaeon]